MNIVSWNVNGIRAIIKKNKQGEATIEGNVIAELVKEYNVDVLCLQETKYHEPYTLNFPYEYHNLATKKGYSGVAVYSKIKPINIYKNFHELNLDTDLPHVPEDYESEGRVLTLEFDKMYLVNVYVPNSKKDLERLNQRCTKWELSVRNYINKLQKNKNVIYCGDLNVVPTKFDIYDPNYPRYPGYTTEEQQEFNLLLTKLNMIDSFRYMNPELQKFSFWNYIHKSREFNNGWRIDFFIVSEQLKNNIKKADILTDYHGSDHAPVFLEINI